MELLLTWILSATGLFLTSQIVRGFVLKSMGSAFAASALVGFLNLTLRPILFFLTLPINIITLGLFTFILNAVMLKIAARFLKGFDILGWSPAIIGAVVLALINMILFSIF
jgi:putative membrane protein